MRSQDKLLFMVQLLFGVLAFMVPLNGKSLSAEPIIDSMLTLAEALDGLPSDCPCAIVDELMILDVEYLSYDQMLHRGQLVIHKDLKDDLLHVFRVALESRFPIEKVIPLSVSQFRRNEKWDDELSMEANNTSCFNYRQITNGGKLSNHALGRAIDINPLHNPYIKGNVILPKGAHYDPKRLGTLTKDHPVTKAFIDRGWEWGGDWTSLKDYQHFEKPTAK